MSSCQCLDATCKHAKLTEHVNREVAARPELVQTETAHRNPKERRPGTLSRHEYTEISSPEDESEDAESVTLCESSKTAIVVYGEGAGSPRTVCTDSDCPIHHPRRVIRIDPDAEARQREHEKETGPPHTSALTTHAEIPGENEIDSLTEAEQVFAPPELKKPAAIKKVATKKAAKKPNPVKAKSAKEKTTTKRIAA